MNIKMGGPTGVVTFLSAGILAAIVTGVGTMVNDWDVIDRDAYAMILIGFCLSFFIAWLALATVIDAWAEAMSSKKKNLDKLVTGPASLLFGSVLTALLTRWGAARNDWDVMGSIAVFCFLLTMVAGSLATIIGVICESRAGSGPYECAEEGSWKSIRDTYGDHSNRSESVYDGLEACKQGERLFGERKHREALRCFDKAIACGFDGRRVYGLRGSCLQSLGFKLDAIDDLSEAIKRAPEEASNYFSRALSKQTTGDFTGAITDFEEAIRLSKAESSYNDFWNDYAKETGWPSATAVYECYLGMAHSAKSGYESRYEMEKRMHAKDPARWPEPIKNESASWRRRRKQSGTGQSQAEANLKQGQAVDEAAPPVSTQTDRSL